MQAAAALEGHVEAVQLTEEEHKLVLEVPAERLRPPMPCFEVRVVARRAGRSDRRRVIRSPYPMIKAKV